MTAQTPEELKKNFQDQLATTEKQISELESNLTRAKEYRVKLLGGLETLAILNPEEEAPAEEAPTEVVAE